MKKCKRCGKGLKGLSPSKIINRKFCNNKCMGLSYRRHEQIKYCKCCNKKLYRKAREKFADFKVRMYCGHSCVARKTFLKWSVDGIYQEFKEIDGDNKYNLTFMENNFPQIASAIKRRFGKHAWYKFIKSIDREPLVNRVNPLKRQDASKLLRYINQETDINIGDTFTHPQEEGIVFDNTMWTDNGWRTKNALSYLIKLKTIGLVRRGAGGGKWEKRANVYKLLKTRI